MSKGEDNHIDNPAKRVSELIDIIYPNLTPEEKRIISKIRPVRVFQMNWQ